MKNKHYYYTVYIHWEMVFGMGPWRCYKYFNTCSEAMEYLTSTFDSPFDGGNYVDDPITLNYVLCWESGNGTPQAPLREHEVVIRELLVT